MQASAAKVVEACFFYAAVKLIANIVGSPKIDFAKLVLKNLIVYEDGRC